jgi:hypothetical protein
VQRWPSFTFVLHIAFDTTEKDNPIMFHLIVLLSLAVVAVVQGSLTKMEDPALNFKFNETVPVKGNVATSRDTIISRAQNWVDRAIPYSQSDQTGKFPR